MDDIVALYRTEDLPRLDALESDLKKRYEIRVLGELNWFLGIRVLRDRSARKAWLCQDSYIDKIATRFHLEYHRPAVVPLPPVDIQPYDGKATDQEIYAYQQRVGSINFAAVVTRPDVAFAASQLATALCNPSPAHLATAN